MKRRMVWRYWCEFCGKGGCSAGHMERHEAACTANPGRVCRMCANTGTTQAPMAELVAIASETCSTDAERVALVSKIEAAADGCPVCVFAAIRQAGRVSGKFKAAGDNFECVDPGLPFDLKTRLREKWAEVDALRAECY